MTPPRQDTGARNLRVLLVGTDPVLEEEFRATLEAIPDTHSVLHVVDTHRQALEMARGRQPNLIIAELDREPAEVAALARELLEVVPGAAIAAVFRRDQLEQGESESATIIELLRAQVRDFIRRPLSATEVRAVIDRLFAAAPARVEEPRGLVVSWLGNKGGVGKSTLAVNVACGLAARHPDQVLLVDAALQNGTCASMLDLKPSSSIVDAVRQRDRLDATLLRHLTLKHDTGLRVLPAPADALEAAEVDDEAVARVLTMARRSFRFVLVDTGATIDNVLMTVLDLTDQGYIVLQGLAPSVAAAAKLLPVLEGLGFPAARQRLVLNDNYAPFLGSLRAVDVADRLQRTLGHVIPYERRVLASMNTGSPQLLHTTWWQKFGKAVAGIVDDLDATAAPTDSESGSTEDGSPRARLGGDRRAGAGGA